MSITTIFPSHIVQCFFHYLSSGLVEHEDFAIDVELVVLQETPLLRVHLLHVPHEPWIKTLVTTF